MKRRVVITGVGLVTPLGTGTSATWSALCEGKSGIGLITRFDASNFKTQIAGEVKDFNPEDFLRKRDVGRTELFIAYAVASAHMAIEDSNLKIDNTNSEKVGVIIGCGLGGLDMVEKTTVVLNKKGPRRVSPFFIPMLIGNMAPGMVSIYFGAKGPNSSIATACAAGAHAVGDAYRVIQRGDADVMIAGGVESVITPTCIAGFNALKALSTRNDEPLKASRPFDKNRDGFVIGEGSGILILENLDTALDRGAKIYAEICGYGMSGDAFHMTAPAPEGEGAVRCMNAALKDAGLPYDSVDYINAHGTATQLNDVFETKAVKTVFKDKAYSIPMSSTKSMTGHLLGGAGGVESVFTILSICNGIIPPTINLDTSDIECDLDYVPNISRKHDIDIAMTNSFGFGGMNASLIFKKFKES